MLGKITKRITCMPQCSSMQSVVWYFDTTQQFLDVMNSLDRIICKEFRFDYKTHDSEKSVTKYQANANSTFRMVVLADLGQRVIKLSTEM
jgi:hypothetical protein